MTQYDANSAGNVCTKPRYLSYEIERYLCVKLIFEFLFIHFSDCLSLSQWFSIKNSY